MEQSLGLFENAGVVVYAVIGLFVLLIVWAGYRLARNKGRGSGGGLPAGSETAGETFESVSEEIKQGEEKQAAATIGKGNFNCLCFRKVKGLLVADFTAISEPVGEMYQFDPSCPISGSGYIVKEQDEGPIVDYDPREVKFQEDESPDHAWSALNWVADVNGFWIVPGQWWKNMANWYAAAVLGLCFLGILVVLG